MPIPFIIAGAALLAAGIGVKKGFDAKENFSEADRLAKDAARKFEQAKDSLESKRKEEMERLAELGKLRLQTESHSITEFAKLYQQVKNPPNITEIKIKSGDIPIEEVDVNQMTVSAYQATNFIQHGISGISTGALVGVGVGQTVGMLGAASTGAAISGLSGAAATNATLAWLGGGSLASGGLGMAGGTAVLGGVIAGPVIAVMGYMAANQSEKALTAANANAAEVAKAVEQSKKAAVLLDAIGLRTQEVSQIIAAIDQRLCSTMNRVAYMLKEVRRARQPGSEKVNYKILEEHEQKEFDFMLILGPALFQVLKVNILDDEGLVTHESGALVKNMQHLLRESVV